MKEDETVVSQILEEAAESNMDQLLLISRSDKSCVYFLSKGRVKKGILFDHNIAHAITETFGQESDQSFHFEQTGKRFLARYELTPSSIGDCLSVTLREEDDGR